MVGVWLSGAGVCWQEMVSRNGLWVSAPRCARLANWAARYIGIPDRKGRWKKVWPILLLFGVVVRYFLLAPLRRLLALTFARPSQVGTSSVHVVILIFGAGLLPLGGVAAWRTVCQGLLLWQGRMPQLGCGKSFGACSHLSSLWFLFGRPIVAIRPGMLLRIGLS